MACVNLPTPPALPNILPIVLTVTLPSLTVSAELCCKIQIDIDLNKFLPIPLLAVIPEPSVITTMRVAVDTQMEVIKTYLRAIPRDCPLE